MLKKNDTLIVDIVDMTSEGYGVCRHENYVIFVLGCATGDKAEIKMMKVLKNFGYGKLIRLIEPSSLREDNDCTAFPSCGGCVFRHIKYEEELKIKKNIVEHNFHSIGGFDFQSIEITPSPKTYGYRNKAEYPAFQDKDNIRFGFYARGSHRVVKCEECLLQPCFFKDIVECVTKYCDDNKIRAYDEESGIGTIRHLFIRCGVETDEVMVCLVSRKDKLRNESDLISSLLKTNRNIKSIILDINKSNSNVILSTEYRVLYGRDYIQEKLNGLTFNISLLSFFQVNKYSAELLYNRVREYASPTKDDVLIDLYCGTGTIGLCMAKQSKEVIGVEITEAAVKNAKTNAEINGIYNSTFICGDSGTISSELSGKGIRPDVIILDPPRAGVDARTVEHTIKMNPKKIVMVSCNSATAARDCKQFCELGYKITNISVFDMFPKTGHVETVVLLTLKNQK